MMLMLIRRGERVVINGLHGWHESVQSTTAHFSRDEEHFNIMMMIRGTATKHGVPVSRVELVVVVHGLL